MTEKPTAINTALSKAWPNLRYLSLGVWTAWLFLVSSGVIWLSDTEFDGSNLAQLMLGMSAVGALVCFIAPPARRWVESLLAKRSPIMIVSFVGAVGAFAIILAGPYYLAFPPIFYAGIVMISVFSSVFVLKCGSLFGRLDSKRVFLFALYSEILMVVLSYFITGNDFFVPVSGGPPLAGILAFTFLPLIASWLVCLPSSGSENGQSQSKETSQNRGLSEEQKQVEATDEPQPKPLPSTTSATAASKELLQQQHSSSRSTSRVSQYPSDFWRLLFMIFFFTLASEMFRYYAVFVQVPDITIVDSKLVLLLRLGFAIVMLFYALRTHRKIRFSKMYQYSMVILAVVVALVPLLSEQSIILGSLIGGVSACMNLLIWCLLSMVVSEKNVPSVVVFGFGWGTLLTARACGWLLGMGILPNLIGTGWGSLVYWGAALLILVAAVLLFSENRLDKLFGSVANGQISLGIEQSSEVAEKEHRPWHEASLKVGKQAMLSQREMEVFELITIGRSPKNVAKHLVVSVNTVRTHIRNIYTKTGAHSHEELVELIEQEIKSLEE